MNMQKFPSLLILMLYAISYHKMTALPALYPVGEDQDKSYLDGYPQKQALENYAHYLLIILQRSDALSNINLALWNKHFDNEDQACSAVDEFIRKRAEDFRVQTGRGCKETYRCDYDSYRFPSTLIAVDCASNDGSYCSKTEDRPARGACIGDQYGLHTLRFIPDSPIPVEQRQVNSFNAASGVGESNHEQGRWAFQRTTTVKGCICV